MVTLGGLTAAEGLIWQPLVMCLGPTQTDMLAVGMYMSNTSPITLPTTKGSTEAAIDPRKEKEKERDRDIERERSRDSFIYRRRIVERMS